MDGRLLAEAMANAEPLKSKTETLEAKPEISRETWQQTLTISHVRVDRSIRRRERRLYTLAAVWWRRSNPRASIEKPLIWL